MIAWRILSKVNDNSSKPGVTKGSIKALIKCLDCVFSNTDKKIYSISVPLVQEIYHSIFQTLELDTDSEAGNSAVDEERKIISSAQRYVLRVQELLGVPIRWIGVGPNRLDQIDRGEGWDLATSTTTTTADDK